MNRIFQPPLEPFGFRKGQSRWLPIGKPKAPGPFFRERGAVEAHLVPGGSGLGIGDEFENRCFDLCNAVQSRPGHGPGQDVFQHFDFPLFPLFYAESSDPFALFHRFAAGPVTGIVV